LRAVEGSGGGSLRWAVRNRLFALSSLWTKPSISTSPQGGEKGISAKIAVKIGEKKEEGGIEIPLKSL